MICADSFELKNRNPTQFHCFQISALLRWTCCLAWQPSADSITATLRFIWSKLLDPIAPWPVLVFLFPDVSCATEPCVSVADSLWTCPGDNWCDPSSNRYQIWCLSVSSEHLMKTKWHLKGLGKHLQSLFLCVCSVPLWIPPQNQPHPSIPSHSDCPIVVLFTSCVVKVLCSKCCWKHFINTSALFFTHKHVDVDT